MPSSLLNNSGCLRLISLLPFMLCFSTVRGERLPLRPYTVADGLAHNEINKIVRDSRVSLSYETVREWCLKFGQTYANGLRHKSPRLGDRWHLDEVFLKINRRTHFLWRAVDQDGDVVDILVQRHRDKKAARNSSASC